MRQPWAENDEDVSARNKVLHEPYHPYPVRPGENVFCLISKGPGALCGVNVPVWQLSPNGIEFEVFGPSQIEEGTDFELNLNVTGHSTRLSVSCVVPVFKINGRNILGCRIISRVEQPLFSKELNKRQGIRWVCDERFLPTGVAQSPGKFSDKILFQVRDVSSQGLQLSSSLRNKYIFEGMLLETNIHFPATASIKIDLKIVRLEVYEEKGRPFVRIGTSFVSLSDKARRVLGQYLLRFAKLSSQRATPESLRKEGFVVKTISDAIEFDYVRSEKEYQEVLQLRYRAYVDAGRMEASHTVDDMSDDYDRTSRIVIGRHRGRIVATMRLVFPKIGDRFEQQQYTVFPPNFPKPCDSVEASRASTDKAYRHTDLLMMLMRYANVIAVQSGRTYSVCCAHEDVAKIYLRWAYRDTGIRIQHGKFKKETHIVCIAKIQDFALGSGNALTWMGTFLGTESLIRAETFSKNTVFGKARVALYRKAAPVVVKCATHPRVERVLKRVFEPSILRFWGKRSKKKKTPTT
ncbi:MAG: GNAT family N-acetyltransferase [Hymenobacter sp.]|nr:MAG: GNAT family N-acetyltransferase [Hymenobacter sp.]